MLIQRDHPTIASMTDLRSGDATRLHDSFLKLGEYYMKISWDKNEFEAAYSPGQSKKCGAEFYDYLNENGTKFYRINIGNKSYRAYSVQKFRDIIFLRIADASKEDIHFINKVVKEACIAEIRKNSRILAQAYISSSSIFFTLPSEILIKILSFTDNRNLPPEEAEKIARDHFDKPSQKSKQEETYCGFKPGFFLIGKRF